MTYCVELTELVISNSQRVDMLETYLAAKPQYGRQYTSGSDALTPLTIVGGYAKTDLIIHIENQIDADLIDASYFVSNFGINPHVDDNRQCIISYEIQNKENIPINFHTPDGKTTRIWYTDNHPLMWNPQVMHSADRSDSERIFFQIELKRDSVFTDYLKLLTPTHKGDHTT